MKHEMTQWKYFVPDTPYIWSHVELVSEAFHIDDAGPFESTLLPHTHFIW